jgi:hypothetical protein
MGHSLLQLRMLEEAADRLEGQRAILDSSVIATAVGACFSHNGQSALKEFRNQVEAAHKERFQSRATEGVDEQGEGKDFGSHPGDVLKGNARYEYHKIRRRKHQ